MTTTEAAKLVGRDLPQYPSQPLRGPAPRKDEDQSDTEMVVLPDPVGHRMLVALPTMQEITAGGIIVPHVVNERERAATVVGKVLAMGPECYTDPHRFPSGVPWCKVGDAVLFTRYSGGRFRSKDVVTGEMVEYRMMNDDEIIGVVPEGARVEGV